MKAKAKADNFTNITIEQEIWLVNTDRMAQRETATPYLTLQDTHSPFRDESREERHAKLRAQGWMYVKTVEVSLPREREAYLESALQQLDAEREAAKREFSRQIARLDEQRASLLAITYQEEI